MSKINKNSLYFHLLTQEYFETYQELDEFQQDNARGHGVMILDINNKLIAIPLRSGISDNLKNSNRIFSRVKNYVNKYIKICSRIENGEAVTFRTLTPYRFSTLRNFHNELGIAISKEDFINQLKENF